MPIQRTPAVLPWLLLLLTSLAALGGIAWDLWPDASLSLRSRGLPAASRPVSAAPPAGRYRVRLFFPETSSRLFREEERELIQQASLPVEIRAVLGELAKGDPPPLPAGAMVRHVFLDSFGILYLDFSRDYQTVLTRSVPPAELAVAALVNTLTASFPSVQRVQLLLEGQEIPMVVGGLDLGRPLSPHLPEQLPGSSQASPQ